MKDTYDVIIVGTGVAGCFAALHLPASADILMITKADLKESDSYLAQGGICVLKGDDDYEAFLKDTLKAGHYENRRESVDIMIRSSREVIDELIGYGVKFNEEHGQLSYTKEGAHSINRILYHEDITGEAITSVLLEQVSKLPNVELCDHTEMLDILCRENRCHGIVLRTKEGEVRPVLSQDVLWATGGVGGIYTHSTNYPHLTGDALSLSMKHDIRLENVDYVQIHPTTLYSKTPGRRFLISESVRGEGAVLYNKDGRRFTNELLPRDLLTEEIYRQMEKDKAPCVWLSMMTIKDLDVKKRFPHIVERCAEEGYDVTRECIPVVPAQHYFMGGVWVDSTSKTSMDHLYAAGETSCNGVHGANRLASNSLLESLVFAKRAAARIAGSTAKVQAMNHGGMTASAVEKKFQISFADYDRKDYWEDSRRRVWEEIRTRQVKRSSRAV